MASFLDHIDLCTRRKARVATDALAFDVGKRIFFHDYTVF